MNLKQNKKEGEGEGDNSDDGDEPNFDINLEGKHLWNCKTIRVNLTFFVLIDYQEFLIKNIANNLKINKVKITQCIIIY